MAEDGTEMLLAAIFAQARVDVEAVFAHVTQLRRACAEGRLARYVATNGLPLATEDERTALWWYADRRVLPKELAAMVRTIGQYGRHCRHCCLAAGRGEGGQVVQR
jgi:hypothetical protein